MSTCETKAQKVLRKLKMRSRECSFWAARSKSPSGTKRPNRRLSSERLDRAAARACAWTRARADFGPRPKQWLKPGRKHCNIFILKRFHKIGPGTIFFFDFRGKNRRKSA